MHILTDENGTPSLHGHSSCSEGHCGSCQAHQAHASGEQLPDPASPQQASAVLTVLHRQQQQAIAQLDRLVNTLMDLDCEDSAMQLQKAVDDFSKGNLYLGLALSLLKEE